MVKEPVDLRTYRKSRGLSQEAVGFLAGRDNGLISKIERGLVEASPETIVRIARGLGISIKRLQAMLAAIPTAERDVAS